MKDFDLNQDLEAPNQLDDVSALGQEVDEIGQDVGEIGP